MSDAFLAGLGSVTIQLIIGIAAVMAVRALAGRRIGAQWMALLWWIVLLRAAVPLTVELDWVAVPVFHAPSSALPIAAPSAAAPMEPSETFHVVSTAPRAGSSAQAEPAVSSPISPADGIVAAWLVVAVVLAAARLTHYRRAARRILVASAAAPESWRAVFEECRAVMGVRSLPAMLVSSAVHAPLLMGAIRPKIILPASWTETMSRDDLRHYLLHELAHLRRGDIGFGWLWFAVQTIHWFNPAMWWAGRCIRLDRELACDEAVLIRSGGESAAYGHALLRAAQSIPPRAAASIGWAGVAEDKRAMERRIVMIRDFKRRGAAMRIAGLGAAVCAGTLCFVQLWAVGQTRAQAEAQAQEAAARAAAERAVAEAGGEGALDAAMNAAIAEGDLVAACEAVMGRVKIRAAEGNVWKDKVDLSAVAEGFKKKGKPADEAERAAMLAALADYAAAHAGDPDYGWRVHHLRSLFADDAAAREQYLREALAAYPLVEYSDPAKHSKFQHLVNELALLLWDSQGKEAAEAYIVETWKSDRRFAYFFEPGLSERYAGDEEGLAALKQRMGEKPPVREVVIELRPDGWLLDGEPLEAAALVPALKAMLAESELRAVIRPDPAATVESLTAVMDACKSAGIRRIAIAQHTGLSESEWQVR